MTWNIEVQALDYFGLMTGFSTAVLTTGGVGVVAGGRLAAWVVEIVAEAMTSISGVAGAELFLMASVCPLPAEGLNNDGPSACSFCTFSQE